MHARIVHVYNRVEYDIIMDRKGRHYQTAQQKYPVVTELLVLDVHFPDNFN